MSEEKTDGAEERQAAGREPIPEIDFDDPWQDLRKARVQYLNAKHPDRFHSWQRGDVDATELALKRQTIVKENGKPVKSAGGDVLVWQPKEVHDRRKRADNKRWEDVAAKLSGDRDAITKTAKAKKPKPAGT